MKIILDSSAFLRLFSSLYSHHNDSENEKKIFALIKDVFIFAANNANSLLLPFIVIAEVSTNILYQHQQILALEFIELIRENSLLLECADNSLVDHVVDIAKTYKATGGADTLIIAWAIKENAMLITADEQQSKKAKFKSLECYYLYEQFDRERLLKWMNQIMSDNLSK